MNTHHIASAASVALAVIGALFQGSAMACSDPTQLLAASRSGADSLAQIATSVARGINAPTAPSQQANGSRPVVGFWKFAFTAPDGSTTIDAGFQQWHSDGTEITNSGRPAITGNFCLGVWKQRGSSYVLNHWAMAWDPAGDPMEFGGLVNIRETVDVDAGGNHMSGTVTLDLYAGDGTTLITHLGDGTVAATRINP